MLRDYKSAKEALLSSDELLRRGEIMRKLVFPEVHARASRKRESMKKRRDGSVGVRKPFEVGSTVMLQDPIRSSKNEPYWVGPYTVVRVSRAGTYSLLDCAAGGLLGRRPPRDQLKLVQGPKARSGEKSEVYYVEKILDHRGPASRREYLVKWRVQATRMSTIPGSPWPISMTRQRSASTGASERPSVRTARKVLAKLAKYRGVPLLDPP